MQQPLPHSGMSKHTLLTVGIHMADAAMPLLRTVLLLRSTCMSWSTNNRAADAVDDVECSMPWSAIHRTVACASPLVTRFMFSSALVSPVCIGQHTCFHHCRYSCSKTACTTWHWQSYLSDDLQFAKARAVHSRLGLCISMYQHSAMSWSQLELAVTTMHICKKLQHPYPTPLPTV